MMQNSALKPFIDAVNKNDVIRAQSILTHHPEIVGEIFSSAGVNTTALSVILRKMYNMKFIQNGQGRVTLRTEGFSEEEFLHYKSLAITILGKKGVKFDISGLNGDTPLHLACSLGLYDVVNIIIDLAKKQGEDFVRDILSKKNNRGETPQDNISLSCENFGFKKSLIDRMCYFMIDDRCFCDPITMELYANPVITPNGHTFSRESLQAWLRTNTTDPKDNSPLLLAQVRQNFLADDIMELIGPDKYEVKDNIFKVGVRKELICALTGRPLIDPVVASDGATYERSEIEKYLNKYSGHLPRGSVQEKDETGEYTLYPNTFIKNIIEIIKKYDDDLMMVQSCTTLVYDSREQSATATPATTPTLATATAPTQILAASAASTASAAISSLSCSSMMFVASKETTTPDVPIYGVNSSISEKNYLLICSLIEKLKSGGKDKKNEIDALIFILQKTNEGKAVKEVWTQMQQQFPELQRTHTEVFRTLNNLMLYLGGESGSKCYFTI